MTLYVKSPNSLTAQSKIGWRLCTENDSTQIWTEDLRIIAYKEDGKTVKPRYLHLSNATADGYYTLTKGVWLNSSLRIEHVDDKTTVTPRTPRISTTEKTNSPPVPEKSSNTIVIIAAIFLLLIIAGNIYVYLEIKKWRWENERCKATETSQEFEFLNSLPNSVNMNPPRN